MSIGESGDLKFEELQEQGNQIESLADLSPAEKQKKRMETKLYVMRDVGGNTNEKEMHIIRDLWDDLSKSDTFIGLAPIGSVVDGYKLSKSSQAKSDLDLLVLYNKDIDKYEEFEKKLSDAVCVQEKDSGIKIQCIKQPISVEEITKYLIDLNNKEDRADINCAYMLIALTKIVAGKKVKEYREEIAEQIRKIPLDTKNRLLEIILQEFDLEDSFSLAKKKSRLSGISTKEHYKIMEKRKEMWRKRVQKIWGIGEAKK